MAWGAKCRDCGSDVSDNRKKRCQDCYHKWQAGRAWSAVMREKMTGKFSGVANPFYGKKHTDETKAKNASAHIGKQTTLGRKMSADQKAKISDAKRGRKLSISQETRKMQSERMKSLWLDADYRKKVLGASGMSSLEKKALAVIEKHGLPYRFVGHGDFTIGRKIPDFINTNGAKIAVEVYCRKHKEILRGGVDSWIKSRRELFASYGWDTIFLDERSRETEILNALSEVSKD